MDPRTESPPKHDLGLHQLWLLELHMKLPMQPHTAGELITYSVFE